MKKKKNNDLQPWFDYFDALQRLVRNGYLEMRPAEHEAYVTRAAFYSLVAGSDSPEHLSKTVGAPGYLEKIMGVAKRIRTYAAFLSQEGGKYIAHSFALHIVEEDAPHNLLSTLLLRHRRLWWSPWRKRENIKIINYPNNIKQNGNKTELRNQD